MKTKLLVIAAAVFAASCSSPKYTYKFDYHDYNAGRKDKQVIKEVASNPGPVAIQPEMLIAEAPVVALSTAAGADVAAPRTKSAPLTLSKSERKEMIKDVKQALKKAVKLKKAGDTVQTDQSTKALDYDLKMSLVFLLVSILAGALVTISELFWILSVAALVVAVIFFIKWLMRQ